MVCRSVIRKKNNKKKHSLLKTMLQETTEGSIFGKDLPRASATANQQEKDQRKSRK